MKATFSVSCILLFWNLAYAEDPIPTLEWRIRILQRDLPKGNNETHEEKFDYKDKHKNDFHEIYSISIFTNGYQNAYARSESKEMSGEMSLVYDNRKISLMYYYNRGKFEELVRPMGFHTYANPDKDLLNKETYLGGTGTREKAIVELFYVRKTDKTIKQMLIDRVKQMDPTREIHLELEKKK